MKPKALAAALLAIAALAPQADAFQMSKKAIRNQGIFGIKVNKTDMAFYGRADAILSISFQEYTTGSFIVAEVVIVIIIVTAIVRVIRVVTSIIIITIAAVVMIIVIVSMIIILIIVIVMIFSLVVRIVMIVYIVVIHRH